MALSALEQAYMNRVTEAYAPTPEPEPEALIGQTDAAMATPKPPEEPKPQPSGVAEMKPYDPTVRQQLSDFLRAGFEGIGIDRAKARSNAEALIGGPNSPLPLEIGIADFIPFLGTGLQTQEAYRMGGEAIESAKRGELGTAALQAGGAALGLIPGAAGTYKYGKPIVEDLATKAKAGELPVGLSVQPVTEAQAAEMLAAKGVQQPAAPAAEGVVSTRFPTAKKATENPLEQNLIIGLDVAKADPVAFAHNVGMVSKYPNFVSKATTPDAQAEDFINHVKDNLLFLHDSVPEATRTRSKLWYDGARNIATRYASEYNIPDRGVAGIMAALSPQMDWFKNVSLGTRVLEIMSKQQSHVWDAAMTETAKRIWADPKYAPILKDITGKSLAELTDVGQKSLWLRTFDETYLPREHQVVSPEGDFIGVRTKADGKPAGTGWGSNNEIAKAIAIFDNPSIQNISTNLGTQHKVRNFYNNIFAPNDPGGHVTIDTHAVAAGLLRPFSGKSREVKHNFGGGLKGEVGTKNSSVTGVNGTYPLYAEAYRRAAAERGILPREMQSITWEAVRGLFPDTYKKPQNAAQIDGIWLKYKEGKISLEEARNEVTTAAGGINPPEWERPGLHGGAAAKIQPSDNQGELPGAGVPGRRAGRPRRVKPAGGNQAGVTTQQGGTE